jgi:hypothetical protein
MNDSPLVSIRFAADVLMHFSILLPDLPTQSDRHAVRPTPDYRPASEVLEPDHGHIGVLRTYGSVYGGRKRLP